MDNNEAKLILSVYRPNGADARDPAFREALQQAERDPALKAWMAEQQAFDAEAAAAMADLPTSPEHRAAIAATIRVARLRPRPFFRWRTLAAAAGVALLLALWSPWSRRDRLTLPDGRSIAEQAAFLSEHHASFGMVSTDLEKLQAWIAARGSPLPTHVPPGLAGLHLLGCESWATTRGRVSLICFVDNDQLAYHLFVFDRLPEPPKDSNLPGIAAPRFERSGTWSFAVWQEEGRAHVLGTSRPGGETANLSRFFST
jgi:hypothetical protein